MRTYVEFPLDLTSLCACTAYAEKGAKFASSLVKEDPPLVTNRSPIRSGRETSSNTPHWYPICMCLCIFLTV